MFTAFALDLFAVHRRGKKPSQRIILPIAARDIEAAMPDM
jgi:hypothetical protein